MCNANADCVHVGLSPATSLAWSTPYCVWRLFSMNIVRSTKQNTSLCTSVLFPLRSVKCMEAPYSGFVSSVTQVTSHALCAKCPHFTTVVGRNMRERRRTTGKENVVGTSKSHGCDAEILSSSSYSNRRLRTARSSVRSAKPFPDRISPISPQIGGLLWAANLICGVGRRRRGGDWWLTCMYSLLHQYLIHRVYSMYRYLRTRFLHWQLENGRRSRRPLSVSNAKPNPPSQIIIIIIGAEEGFLSIAAVDLLDNPWGCLLIILSKLSFSTSSSSSENSLANRSFLIL